MTLLGEFVKRRLEPTNIVMFYLLAVVIAAIRWGQGPAVVTSVLSVLAFDFFLNPAVSYVECSSSRVSFYLCSFFSQLVLL